MSKILVNLPQQTYILRNCYTLGLKDAPCTCDECGTVIKKVCVVQGKATGEYFNLGTTCVEKHSKEDENFLTSASQYRLKTAKKAISKINKFVKLYKEVSSNPDVIGKFLSIYTEKKRTGNVFVTHAKVTLFWLYNPESRIDRSNENWYLGTNSGFAWDSSRHMKDDIELDLGWIDVSKNSELREIFSNTEWEYPVTDDFSNDALVAAEKVGYQDPEFSKEYSNNHFDWYLRQHYSKWYDDEHKIYNEITQLKKEHGITW